ncbi:coenzyme F420-0:L-glutamate ligase [Nonomuraea typhae]|uniref:Coenzyme F420-0:L-glutamate ligase n=1 Tax=Nonomuraea typhae TaxID=2603600 RepID=A0ABW7Z060_9ACTN
MTAPEGAAPGAATPEDAVESPVVEVLPVPGLPEVRPGDDLAALLGGAGLRDGDIVVITSKIVSKAENRVRHAPDRTAAIAEETERVVARRGDMVIAQTRHGFVMAAAGVDNSNVAPGTVLLLPEDGDASARRIRAGLTPRVGVIVSDTFGRPWRHGLTDVAIGAAGVLPLEDFRGGEDAYGNPLNATVTALADEIAAAAELVKGKLAGVPVAIVRGLAHLVTEEDGPGVRPLIRPADEDLFRYGSRDVVFARRTVSEFTAEPVDPAVVRQAVAAAFAAPDEGRTRFVLVESPDVREKVLGRAVPYLLVPCVTEPGELAAARAGAAVQNLLVQLAMEGLGSAWTPPGGRETVLDLPAGWRPVGLVAVGHPAVTPPDREPQDLASRVVLR